MKLITFFFLLITASSFSQSFFSNKNKAESNIVTAPTFAKGFYTSLDNLRNKQPIPTNHVFDSILYLIRDAVYCKADIDWRNASYDDKIPFYPCKKTEDKLRKTFLISIEIQLDSVWCLYDGSFVYCKLNGNFYPIVMTGRYSLINCYNSYRTTKFNDTEKQEKYVNSAPLDAQDYGRKEFAKDLGYFTGYSNKPKQLLLSLETGKFIELTDESLVEILKKDTELYNEYKNTKSSKVNNERLLLKFNQKYPIQF